jgi:hypothetical protein
MAMNMDDTDPLSRPARENRNSTGWVCENDHSRPFTDEPGCGAGDPCPVCNASCDPCTLPDVSGVIETVALVASEKKD